MKNSIYPVLGIILSAGVGLAITEFTNFEFIKQFPYLFIVAGLAAGLIFKKYKEKNQQSQTDDVSGNTKSGLNIKKHLNLKMKQTIYPALGIILGAGVGLFITEFTNFEFIKQFAFMFIVAGLSAGLIFKKHKEETQRKVD